jgi:hypothetical protein
MAPWAERSSWTAGRHWDLTAVDSRLVDDLKARNSLLALRPTKVRPASDRPTTPRFARERRLTSDTGRGNA